MHFARDMNKPTSPTALLCSYLITAFFLVGGTFVMRYVEATEQNKLQEHIVQQYLSSRSTLFEQIIPKLNATDLSVLDEFLNNLVRFKQYQRYSNQNPQWNVPGSVFFTFTILSTLGYGNFLPVTDNGKVVCIFLALFGIPSFMLSVVLSSSTLRFYFGKIFKFRWWIVVSFFIVFVICLILLFAVGFRVYQGWSYLDAVYFSVNTLMLLSVGDFVPNVTLRNSMHEQALYGIFIVFGIIGIGVIIETFRLMAQMEPPRKVHEIPPGRWQTVM